MITVLGMTSLIAVLASWFEWLRWAGVAYLVWLGVQHWGAAPVALDDIDAAEDRWSRARSGAAFWSRRPIPRHCCFMRRSSRSSLIRRAPAGPQLLLLSVTFLVLATLLDGGYAVLAGRLRPCAGATGGARGRATA